MRKGDSVSATSHGVNRLPTYFADFMRPVQPFFDIRVLVRVAAVLIAMSLASAPVVGQAPPARPDLQGIWISKSATPLERPKALEGKAVLTEKELAELKQRADRLFKKTDSDFAGGDALFLAALADVDRYKNPNATDGSDGMIDRDFDNRTSLIVDPPDGKVPPLTPEGEKRRGAFAASRLRPDPESPEDLSSDRRCLTFGTPRLGGNYGAGPYSFYEIVQTPDYIVLTTEFIHEARIIPLDGRPHLPETLRQWQGDSRGRWEGKTLVIDTTNFSPKAHFMGSAERLHLVERFTRVDDDTINYEITLSDPTTWTKPWTAMIRLKKSRETMYEVACHEGNYYSMQGILAGARAAEKQK